MSEESSNESKKSSKSKVKSVPKLKPLALAAFIAVIIAVGVVILLQSQASPGGESSKRSGTNEPGASFSLTSESKTVASGSTFRVEIWEDSLIEPVNALQANLTYPADKLEFVSLDTSTSAFEIAAQKTGGNGVIQVGLGHSGDKLVSRQRVAVVTLKAIASSGEGTISFTNGSALIRATDNKNILKTTNSLRFTLTAK